MAQLYRVGNPINREERANLNLTLDDIQRRFSLLQSQVDFLAGGADTEALIQEINQAIEDANNATVNVDNALILVGDKLQELELELAKANELKPVGEWNSSTAYKQNNIVTKDGTSYIALVDNTNVDVTDTNTWQVSAAKGDKGDTGKGLTIVGTLTNPSQLPATGNEGEAYYVGTDLYVWMVDHWENIGQIKGDPGSDANVTTANIESALGYTPANQTLLNSFKGQYEFRTATIFNRQIRITKPDASNRIPILLNVDLEQGGPITVSLDSGSTSLELKNVDGTDVTKLEKGFIEIVQTGSFFTLRNKGGLNQSDLDALITLANEAEVNESTLKSEYVDEVNALITPPPLQSNASWNEILLQIPNISANKIEYKEITKNSSNNTTSFQYAGGGSASYNFFNIILSEVGFEPKTILIRSLTSANTSTIWKKDNVFGSSSYNCYISSGTQLKAPYSSSSFNIPFDSPNTSAKIEIYG